MKLSKFLSVSFVLSLLLFSCNKETNNIGGSGKNNSVYISKLGYKFNESEITKSSNKEKVVDVATIDIDENYMLVAELVNVGNIELCETRSKQDVTNLTVVTFYDQVAKGAPRVQENISTEFELPAEGGCTALFLGNVSEEYTFNGTLGRSGGEANQVNSGANLCWYSKSFNGPISDETTVDLSSMTPLFAQIGNIVVPGTTTDNWNINKISNIKMISGNQENSGNITISSTNVSYTKTDINSDALITSDASVGTSSLYKNFIPNKNNCSISADFYLTGKTNPKNLTFSFGKQLEIGKRYNITFKLIRNGIRFEFYVNTQQRGVYNKAFDIEMQKYIRTNNADQLTDAGKTGDYAYFKYGSTIKLPISATRVSTTDFNPTDFMIFDGKWYNSNVCKQGDCYTASTTSGVQVIVDYFQTLKESDVIKLYAYFEPKFYYWDSDRSIKEGGTPIVGKTLTTKDATTSLFTNLPTIEAYGRYLQSPYYYDNGYTDDKQTGVWFRKWTSGTSTTTPFSRENSTAYMYTNNYGVISNGQFPSGVNKNDYFFVPNLGVYDQTTGRAKIEKDPTKGSDGVGYWPSDIPEKSFLQFKLVSAEGPVTQNIMFDDTYMVKYGMEQINGETHVAGTKIATNGFLAIWPDPTYTK